MSYVVWFDRFTPALAARLGGKCTALGELTTAGLPVPPGFAVTTDAYLDACRPLVDRLGEVLAGGPGGAVASAAARALVEAAPLPGGVRDAVASAYAKLCRRCGQEDVPVAVRSSAVGEDAP